MSGGAHRSLVVAGPTASGKSQLAMDLARSLGGEIVSCDSVQLYRGFDIGSAKPTPAERREIPHHMVDIMGWQDGYDASRYAHDAREAIAQILSRDRIPIIVGGTGLYLRALWGEEWDNLPSDERLREELSVLSADQLHQQLTALNPQRAAQIHRNDRYRLQRGLEIALLSKDAAYDKKERQRDEKGRNEHVMIFIAVKREMLHERIARRTANMLDAGLISEVENLVREGCPLTVKPMQSIGYKQVAQLLSGQLARADLAPSIEAATRQYAKRQRTWFHKVPADVYLDEPALSPSLLSTLQSALDIRA